ncbi:MAG: NIPSNAP family protein [Chloroflexota bacterium]
MFTCVIRYEVDLDELEGFRAYAHAWIELIERYGGTHHGYFVPSTTTDDLPDARFSFPGLGKAAPANIGYALFSFPDVDSYEAYRTNVANDPACHAATARFKATPCFTGYERTFLRPIFK